jgi:hypothetical protein
MTSTLTPPPASQWAARGRPCAAAALLAPTAALRIYERWWMLVIAYPGDACCSAAWSAVDITLSRPGTPLLLMWSPAPPIACILWGG